MISVLDVINKINKSIYKKMYPFVNTIVRFLRPHLQFIKISAVLQNYCKKKFWYKNNRVETQHFPRFEDKMTEEILLKTQLYINLFKFNRQKCINLFTEKTYKLIINEGYFIYFLNLHYSSN